MKRTRIAEILMFAGVSLTLLGTLFPGGMTILLSLMIGDGLIIVSFGMYLGIVWRDLKRHRVL